MITTTDPIADMLARVRNAIMVNKREVSLPHSNAKEALATLLVQAGFLDDVKTEDALVGKTLTITINQDGQNARISKVTRLSKPGRRYYVRSRAIPTVKRGRGIVVVSTSHGLMTGEEAKAKGLGGELVCEVY